ncbi:MAG: DUF6125 family protein [Chloroflexi bacterium]|nr:DUF6125 family protein [Chloroflexota bacterium]
MLELNDLSGPFNPRLTFGDFSKGFLIKLINTWQWAWLQMDAAWFDEVKKRHGEQTAWECDLEMWLRVAERCNPRYAKVANIPLKNVVDSLKVLQLPLNNTMGGLYPVEYDIKNENHAFVTVRKCPSLEWCEKQAPERVAPMCHVGKPAIMKKYVVNPAVEVKAVKLPPREVPGDIACKWEFKIAVPKGTNIRSKAEVVDETDKIPELNDLTGKFYPKLTYQNLSKEFILKLIQLYQYAWIIMSGGYYDSVKARFGFDAANQCELASWMRVGERVNPRYAVLANVPLKTVIDSLKITQLPLDNTVGLYPAEYDIRGPNHVVMTIMKCRTLDYFEKSEPERIEPMCRHLEKPVIEKYLVNPKVKVTPLVLPPRQNPEDIACRWEFTLQS